MKIKAKEKAELLRKRGFSFREISEKLKVSKSTASLWTRNIKLSKKAEERKINLSINGRKKAIETNRKKRLLLFEKIDSGCNVLLDKNKYGTDDFKLFLSLLFWGEGAKTGRRLIFINSDPDMIRMFLFLLRNSFKIDNDKIKASLHLHSYHNEVEEITYWSRVAHINSKNIGIYRKANSGKRKKQDYHGCISIRYGDSKILDEVSIILRRFKKIAGVG